MFITIIKWILFALFIVLLGFAIKKLYTMIRTYIDACKLYAAAVEEQENKAKEARDARVAASKAE